MLSIWKIEVLRAMATIQQILTSRHMSKKDLIVAIDLAEGILSTMKEDLDIRS